MPRNGGGDSVERASVGLHYVVSAGAVNVHVHEPRHNRHSRRNVINGARRNRTSSRCPTRRDAAAFNDDHAIVDLFLRVRMRLACITVVGMARARLIQEFKRPTKMLLELRRKSQRACIRCLSATINCHAF